MNRLKKLIRNTIIVVLILFGFYYYGGFHLSKESYIKDFLKGHYYKENEYILEFNYKNRYKTILADFDNMTYVVVGTQNIGFFYTMDSSGNHEIDIEKSIDTYYTYEIEMNGLILIVYRNNLDVDHVVFETKDGNKYIINSWTKNFGTVRIDGEYVKEGLYKLYDKNNQLIEEIIQY